MSLLDSVFVVTFLVFAHFILLWLYHRSIKYVISEKWLILYVFYLPIKYVEYVDIVSIHNVSGLDKLRFMFFNLTYGNFNNSLFGTSVALKVNKSHYKRYKWICLSPKNPNEFIRLLGDKIEKANKANTPTTLERRHGDLIA